MNKIETLKNMIYESDRIVFFGGAGVSTASGIPDFRSADGLFMQDSGYQVSAEEIISHSFFEKYPQIFFDYYFDHLVYPDAKPNACHRYLADLEAKGKEVAIVTKNIDGLHQEAGCQKVYELHGNVWDNYCIKCKRHYRTEDLEKDEQGIPRCSFDQAIVRPNVVLYEEALDQKEILGAVRAIEQADLMIVAGTSLRVYPAAGLIDYFNGSYLAVINKTKIQVDRKDTLVFEDSLTKVFKALDI